VLREVAARFARDGCSLMAAASAFYGLICLIPLGALAVSVFGRVLRSVAISDTEGHVFGLLRQALPLEAPAIEEAIRSFPHPRGPWFVEAVSLLGLLWAASRLFRTLEDVLTRVWSGHGLGRPLFLRNLVALAATGGAGLLFLAMVVVTATAAAVAARPDLPAAWVVFRWLASWVTLVALPAGAWFMFLLMYVFLPQERVSWRAAAIGAGASAAMWEISRVAFAKLVLHGATYGRLYGSLAGTVMLGVWMYLSATIMLAGAELAVALRDRQRTEG
jgi:membrane protein